MIRRIAAVGCLAGGFLLLGATTASAHVGVTPSVTAAGSYSILTFSVPHGCDGSPTTKVSIQIPEQFTSVTPTVNPNWQVQKVMTKLAQPITDSHGNQVTERVGEVVYTAKTPLPDGYRDALALSVKLPENAGEKLVFPTVQTCAKGETAWVEVAKEGQSEDDLEAPAPGFEVTAASADEAGHPTATASTTVEESSALTWVALGVGVLGLATGGAALARTRRS
jgi:uncharacterized protein YcnI